MEIIITILIGAFVGWLASIIMNRNEEQGWLANIAVGIVGAFLGQWIASAFGGYASLRLDFVGFVWSLIGAIVLCGVINLFTRKRIR